MNQFGARTAIKREVGISVEILLDILNVQPFDIDTLDPLVGLLIEPLGDKLSFKSDFIGSDECLGEGELKFSGAGMESKLGVLVLILGTHRNLVGH